MSLLDNSPDVRRWLIGILGVGAVYSVGRPISVRADHGEPYTPVVVIVDMDSDQPGFQSSVVVRPRTERVTRIAIWVYDLNESATIYSVGYAGGLNRSIAFGHVPDPAHNQGAVTEVIPTLGEPIVVGHSTYADRFGIEKLFAGPEFQYLEWGNTPGTISANPSAPIVWIDVELSGASAGDVFRFYVGDMVVPWTAGTKFEFGAFSTTGLISLDTGGDAVLDQTDTLHGVDADVGIAAPPAAFLVDFIDGPTGGATIMVAAVPGDFDGDGDVDLDDFGIFAQCYTGADTMIDVTCIHADRDHDLDVDLDDVSIFADNYTGSL